MSGARATPDLHASAHAPAQSTQHPRTSDPDLNPYTPTRSALCPVSRRDWHTERRRQPQHVLPGDDLHLPEHGLWRLDQHVRLRTHAPHHHERCHHERRRHLRGCPEVATLAASPSHPSCQRPDVLRCAEQLVLRRTLRASQRSCATRRPTRTPLGRWRSSSAPTDVYTNGREYTSSSSNS